MMTGTRRHNEAGLGLSHLEQLPDDVLGIILRQLPLHELLQLELVSRCLWDRVSS